MDSCAKQQTCVYLCACVNVCALPVIAYPQLVFLVAAGWAVTVQGNTFPCSPMDSLLQQMLKWTHRIGSWGFERMNVLVGGSPGGVIPFA